MKTIVIWDTCGQSNLKFFVLEGDFEYLDDTYINASGDDERQQKLNSILKYDAQTGEPSVEMYDKFPKEVFDEHPNEGIEVIVCGFLP